MHRIALAFTLLAGIACGGPPTAPSISNLELSPREGVPPGGVVTANVSFTDDDGDLGGGHGEIALRRTAERKGDRFQVPLEDTSAVRGKLSFTIALPVGAVPGTYELGVAVVDSTGRWSNALASEFVVRTE